MKKCYEYSVKLDGNTVRVEATDKLLASKEAARKLGVSWKERARDMEIFQGRPILRRDPAGS